MESFDAVVSRRRQEARGLVGLSVSEVRPSTRDVAQYVSTGRDGLSVVADLCRRDPAGRHPPQTGRDLLALARVLDEAEIDAAAVGTDAAFFGARLEDLAAVSEACESLPVIRRDFMFTVEQVHESRLHGADAVVLLPALLDPLTFRTLAQAATATHMAVVASCWDEVGLARALELDVRLLEISAIDPRSGDRSLEGLRRLAEQVPRHVAILATGDLDEAEAHSLRGTVDGVVLGERLLVEADPASLVFRIKEGES